MKTEEIAKLTGFISAFTVFCGSTRFILYYRQFKINILDYIDFSEVITLFASDIFIIIPFIALGVALSLLVNKGKTDNFYQTRLGRRIMKLDLLTRVKIYFRKKLHS